MQSFRFRLIHGKPDSPGAVRGPDSFAGKAVPEGVALYPIGQPQCQPIPSVNFIPYPATHLFGFHSSSIDEPGLKTSQPSQAESL
jgi:hypothetical protein